MLFFTITHITSCLLRPLSCFPRLSFYAGKKGSWRPWWYWLSFFTALLKKEACSLFIDVKYKISWIFKPEQNQLIKRACQEQICPTPWMTGHFLLRTQIRQESYWKQDVTKRWRHWAETNQRLLLSRETDKKETKIAHQAHGQEFRTKSISSCIWFQISSLRLKIWWRYKNSIENEKNPRKEQNLRETPWTWIEAKVHEFILWCLATSKNKRKFAEKDWENSKKKHISNQLIKKKWACQERITDLYLNPWFWVLFGWTERWHKNQDNLW